MKMEKVYEALLKVLIDDIEELVKRDQFVNKETILNIVQTIEDVRIEINERMNENKEIENGPSCFNFRK